MSPRVLLAAAALAGALAAPGIAAAQSIAYAVPYSTTNMRAGPGIDYPVVAIIRGGSAVTIYGCLQDFSWCDSSVEDIRGWVSTTRLEFQYGGNLVPIPRYYSYFDAPIIGFDFGYWDRYYYDRPFYRDRHRHRDRDRRHRPRDDTPPPVTKLSPGGSSDERPRRGRPYSERPRQGFDQYQGGDSAGGGNPNTEPRGGGQRRRSSDVDNPPSGGGGGSGKPCPPKNPACR